MIDRLVSVLKHTYRLAEILGDDLYATSAGPKTGERLERLYGYHMHSHRVTGSGACGFDSFLFPMWPIPPSLLRTTFGKHPACEQDRGNRLGRANDRPLRHLQPLP